MPTFADDVTQFLRREITTEDSELGLDTPLFSSGLVDSFSLVALISFIEQRCSLRMSPTDVNLDNLDSIGRILGFVERMDRERQ